MPKVEAPADLPDPIARAYLDGRAMLDQRRWTNAAGSFRTALDRGTRLLWKDPKDPEIHHNLGKRIKALPATFAMPAALIEWAEVVRGVGNEIHALDEVTEDDARDAGHFAEVFLTYAFSLPARLEAFSARRNACAIPDAQGEPPAPAV